MTPRESELFSPKRRHISIGVPGRLSFPKAILMCISAMLTEDAIGVTVGSDSSLTATGESRSGSIAAHTST